MNAKPARMTAGYTNHTQEDSETSFDKQIQRHRGI